MKAINNLNNIIKILENNPHSNIELPLMKIDKLEVSYSIRNEGMLVLKLTTNSKYLKENQFILDYFYQLDELKSYLIDNYDHHIKLVETELVNQIVATKKYAQEKCAMFGEVLKPLCINLSMYYDLVLEAYALNLEQPNLKYHIKTMSLDLCDEDTLVSSRFNIRRKR